MGPGSGRDGRDRQARGPRTRVPHTAEAHRDRQEQLQGSGGRKHGPLELHIAPSPGRAVRTPKLLPDVPRQERRVRGRRVPAEGRPSPTIAQKVQSIHYYVILCVSSMDTLSKPSSFAGRYLIPLFFFFFLIHFFLHIFGTRFSKMSHAAAPPPPPADRIGIFILDGHRRRLSRVVFTHNLFSK